MRIERVSVWFSGRGRRWQDEGVDPDYRFSLANERTFLAWLRTALALLAGAMLVHQFATRLQPQWVNLALSLALVVSSALLSLGAFLRWKGNEIAMRRGRPLPRSMLLLLVTVAVIGLALCVGIILGLQ
uniref:YidH family protein n=1 Tax=Castellaniella defragrans TaxID=75697 RepID=UPI00333FAAA9